MARARHRLPMATRRGQLRLVMTVEHEDRALIAFDFGRFYDLMKAKGFIIYPGKLTVVDSFRVGCIGRMDEHV